MTTALQHPDSLTIRRASGRASLAAALGGHLASMLVVAYSALVPVVIIPVGRETFSLCEPLLILTAIALLFVRPMAAPRVHHIAMALYLATTLISLWQIGDSELLVGSAKRWLRLVAIAAPLFLPLVLPVTRQVTRRAIDAFIWGGFIAILIGMVLYWLQIPIREESQKLWLGTGAPILRASGLVADTAAFGHLIAVLALVTLGSLWTDNRANRIALTVLVGGFVLYALAASSSRAALLDILGGLFTFCLLNRGPRLVHRNRAIVGMLLGSAALTVVLAWLLLASNSQRTGAIEGSLTRFLGGGDTSINSFSSGRLDSWTSYVSQCGDYLLAGTGYKTATFVLPGKFPDNAFLGITVEVGIPGLVCMLFFIGSVFCGLVGQRRAGNPYAALVLALWVGQMLHAMTADSFTLFSTMPFVYLLTALVLQADPASFTTRNVAPAFDPVPKAVL